MGVVSGMITSVKLRAKEGLKIVSYFCSMFSFISVPMDRSSYLRSQFTNKVRSLTLPLLLEA